MATLLSPGVPLRDVELISQECCNERIKAITERGRIELNQILISLECTATWLENGCAPLSAAEEIRMNIRAVERILEQKNYA